MNGSNMNSNKNAVPAAPVLKFPTSYNGKKNQEVKAAPKTAETVFLAASTKPTAALTLEEKRAMEIKDPQGFYDWALKVDANQDMRRLSRLERLALLEGPTINLLCADKVVGTMPMRLAVATSDVAFDAFVKKGGKPLSEMRIPYQGVESAVKRLAKYMVQVMEVRKHPFSLPSTILADDMDLLLVANATGMDLYVENLSRYCWAVLKSEPLPEIGFDSLRALDACIDEATDKFPTIRMFVQRWGSIGYYQKEDDKPIIALWRNKLPNLEAAVQRFLAERTKNRTGKRPQQSGTSPASK